MPKGSPYERKVKRVLEELGYIVIRSAGSLGDGDLVAISPPPECYAFIIEVKSTNDNKFTVSNTQKEKEQYYMMRDRAELGYPCLYIVRWKGDKQDIGKDEIDKMSVYPVWFPDGTYKNQANQKHPSFHRSSGLGMREVFIDHSDRVEDLEKIGKNFFMRGLK